MDFPSNSRTPNLPGVVVSGSGGKEKKPPVEKVVVTEAIQRKKPLSRRFKELFVGGEAKNVFRYISGDVLLPAVRNMIVDGTSKGIERLIYGETQGRRRSAPGRPTMTYNSPERYSRDRTSHLPDQPPHVVRRRQEYAEIILHSREEAELVLERLYDIIDGYEVASVADLHDLVGLPTTFVDNKWGWSNLRGTSIRQIREGYLLDLPVIESI